MTRLTLALLLVGSAGCRHLGGGGASPSFVLVDPAGDDHGDGDLVYPRSPDLAPGDLDLLRLEARPEEGGTLFTATFARPVRVPYRRAVDDAGGQLTDVARNGFYTLNLDVYVDLDRVPGSGEVRMVPGRKAEVDPASAWERAIVLTPRPGEARAALKRLWLEEAKRRRSETASLGARDIAALEAEVEVRAEKVFFPTRVRVSGRTISFFVPPEVLGGPARADAAYVVAVTGADLALKVDLASFLGRAREGGLFVMGIAAGPPRDANFGGGREGDPLQPPLVDVVVPPGGPTQEQLLAGDPARRDEPRRLPGVVPAEAGPR